MVRQDDTTIYENESSDRQVDDISGFKNPMYDSGATNFDGIKVKENIYSYIEEAQGPLNTAADQNNV